MGGNLLPEGTGMALQLGAMHGFQKAVLVTRAKIGNSPGTLLSVTGIDLGYGGKLVESGVLRITRIRRL